MPDLFPEKKGTFSIDIDELQYKLDSLSAPEIATVVSYDYRTGTGVAENSTNKNIRFVNLTGNELLENRSVFILSKGGVNYVLGTDRTESGWASTQIVVRRPTNETNTLALSLSKQDVGTMVILTATTGTVDIPVTHNLTLSAGQSIDFLRSGAAEVAFRAAGNNNQVTVSATPGLRLRAQWSACTLMCIGLNQYVVIGDLKV